MSSHEKSFSGRKDFISFCSTENREFFLTNRRRAYVEYIREPGWLEELPDKQVRRHRGNPVGVMVAIRNPDDSVTMGWSAVKKTVGKKGEPGFRKGDYFTKAIGLWKAIQKATGHYPNLGQVKMPDKVTMAMGDFHRRATEELFKPPKQVISQDEITTIPVM